MTPTQCQTRPQENEHGIAAQELYQPGPSGLGGFTELGTEPSPQPAGRGSHPPCPTGAGGRRTLSHSVRFGRLLRQSCYAPCRRRPSWTTRPPRFTSRPAPSGCLKTPGLRPRRLNHEFVGASTCSSPPSWDRGPRTWVRAKHIERERVYQRLTQVRGGHRVNDPDAQSRYRPLNRYNIDLTRMASEGKLDPVVGRDLEVRAGQARP